MDRLGLGCAKLGSVGAGAGMKESLALVHGALDRGVSLFDTSDAYGAGSSEHLLGRALHGRREQATIATKGGYVVAERSGLERRARMLAARVLHRSVPDRAVGGAGSANYAAQDFSPAHLGAALEASLRRLRTDHVDIYQLHGPRELLPEACAWGEEAVASGKIGRFGVGAEDLHQARPWIGVEPVTVLQLPFGLLDPEAATDLIPRADKAGVEVIARGVLGAGQLGGAPTAVRSEGATPKQRLVSSVRRVASEAGCSPLQLALWYVLARPDVGRILVGASSMAHLDELVAGASAVPDAEVIGALEHLVGAHDGG